MPPSSTSLTYGQLVLRSLQRYPGRLAFSSDDDQWTYAATLEMIGRFQRVYEKHELSRGDRLVVLSGNRADSWVCGLSAQVSGLAISSLHPLSSLEDHLYQISDFKPSAVVVDSRTYATRGRELAESLDPSVKLFSLGPSDFGIDIRQACEDIGTATPKDIAHVDDITMISYTGGTTGRSKGVVRDHHSFFCSPTIMISDFEIEDQAQFLAVAPISHMAGGFVPCVLERGGTVHLQSGFDPDRVLRSIENDRISMSVVAPTMIYKMLDSPLINQVDASSLQTMIYGAATMSPRRMQEALDRFGPVFTQLYGQTETLPVSILRKSDHRIDRPDLFASCGFASLMADLKIVDDDGNRLPDGEPGELCAKTPTAMLEYHNLPEETAKTMVDGWIHTGDIAQRNEEGYYFIVDRKKDMIVTGGFNVYPRAVEDVLSSDSSVSMIAVVGVPDETWGEAVTAVVVCTEGSKQDEAQLKNLVKEKLGSLQTPKKIEFVKELPLTSVGKVDKKTLREKYWAAHERKV